jgi:hypothetical protein
MFRSWQRLTIRKLIVILCRGAALLRTSRRDLDVLLLKTED